MLQTLQFSRLTFCLKKTNTSQGLCQTQRERERELVKERQNLNECKCESLNGSAGVGACIIKHTQTHDAHFVCVCVGGAGGV